MKKEIGTDEIPETIGVLIKIANEAVGEMGAPDVGDGMAVTVVEDGMGEDPKRAAKDMNRATNKRMEERNAPGTANRIAAANEVDEANAKATDLLDEENVLAGGTPPATKPPRK